MCEAIELETRLRESGITSSSGMVMPSSCNSVLNLFTQRPRASSHISIDSMPGTNSGNDGDIQENAASYESW